MRLQALLLLGALSIGPVMSVSHDPYNRSRIFWDVNSTATIFPTGTYGRVMQLQDGRLMAVCEYSGICISFSDDIGATWREPTRIVSNASKLPNAVPDMIQLADGTIIVGYNPRPSSPYTEDRKFGIRCVRSTDNGSTWSNPIFINDASYLFSDGCWEPAFLELPSGELQCYFADEGPYTTTSEQCISMCRSFDKGLTWSEPVKVSFRSGKRDGMPVPILTKDGKEIVVIIEDNGWGRSGFAATTVRTTIEDNWSSGYVGAPSSKRSLIFETTPASTLISAAPYLCVLPNGETVASYQGSEGRSSNTDNQYYDMFVEVGDTSARNFKGRTQPFNLPLSQHAQWNSVAVVDTGIVVAVASVGEVNGTNAVKMMRGYPMKQFRANYGTPTLDGALPKTEAWTCTLARQIYMGYQLAGRTTADFLYDDDNLYFAANVVDRTINTSAVDGDGIELFLDVKNVCDTYPQEGCFRFFFNPSGTVTAKYGSSNKWVAASDTMSVRSVVTRKSSYYIIEAAIPWKSLGLDKAPVGNTLRATLEVTNRTTSDITTETVPDAVAMRSWTWPELTLVDKSSTPVTKVNEDCHTSLNVVTSGTEAVVSLDANANDTLLSVAIYSTCGVKLDERLASADGSVRILLPSHSIALLSARLASGLVLTRKVVASAR
jgi:hypothetical protein